MGFIGPEKYIASDLKAKLDGRGNYETLGEKYVTSLPSIYAAGGKNFFKMMYTKICIQSNCVHR